MKNTLSNFTLLIVAFLTFSVSAHAKAASCEPHLLAFTVWEDEIKGEIVTKRSFFELVDWDPNSQFDGVVLTKTASKTLKKPVLEFEFIPKSGGSRKVEFYDVLLPLESNESLLQFEELKPKEFFTMEQPGYFLVRLKVQGRVLCEDRFKYSIGH